MTVAIPPCRMAIAVGCGAERRCVIGPKWKAQIWICQKVQWRSDLEEGPDHADPSRHSRERQISVLNIMSHSESLLIIYQYVFILLQIFAWEELPLIYLIIRRCVRTGAFPGAFCVPNSVALASPTLWGVQWAIH